MSVEQIGTLHQDYIRLSDRFKAAWTFQQYLLGAQRAFQLELVPISVDFQKLYDEVRSVATLISSADTRPATRLMTEVGSQLDEVSRELVARDHGLSPSVLRRFFERVKSQDEKILHQLIKFHLYSGALEGENLDKLDFLFTRLAERFDSISGAFEMRSRQELVRLLESLLRLAPGGLPNLAPEERAAAQHRVSEVAESVRRAANFEDLSERGVLERIRSLKRSLGKSYRDPAILADVIELSIATKNRFRELFGLEEQKLLESSEKVAELERGLGQNASPELREELERFRRFKEIFDRGRQSLNLKHEEILALKNSMVDILSKFEDDLAGDRDDGMIFEERSFHHSILPPDPLLQTHLARVFETVEIAEDGSTVSRNHYSKQLVELRLETWEIGAVRRLLNNEIAPDPQSEELWKLFTCSAALRLRMDEDAREILTAAGPAAEARLRGAGECLKRAKDYDTKFQWYLDEALYAGRGGTIGEISRSKFRLLRSLSGLWLLYNKKTGVVPGV